MKTYRKTIDDKVYFAVTDVDPSLDEALRGLYYSPFEDGFAKSFSADAPNLDSIYANFERHMPDLILQAANQQPVPWEACLTEVLRRLDGQGLDWYLVGSTALAVRGLAVKPHDLDLSVQGQGSARMSELFLDVLVEPVSGSRGWIWDWFGRCFLHARLEWVGDVNAQADQNDPADFGPTALARSETLYWHDYPVKVPPLDLQLAVSERRGLLKRADLIRSLL